MEFNSMVEFRDECQELSKEELDIVIKAQLVAHRSSGGKTKKLKSKDRQRSSQQYFFKGQRVCRQTFCFIHGIERKKLQSIAHSLDTDGLKPRVHGLYKSKPSHSLSYVDRERIRSFICKYAKDNALPLPGRLPNYKQSVALVLPSDKSIADLHAIYELSAPAIGYRNVSLRTFQRTWSDLCPHISLSKPKTDLCPSCQKYAYKLSTTGGVLDDNEKNHMLESYREHVNVAKEQRDHYNQQGVISKDFYRSFPEDNKAGGNAPCSVPGQNHYSWDFAQQVHFPHHAQQVDPIYFQTPRKCHVFGVCSEGSEKQVFYLVDEAQLPGKGANSVASMAHHYLTHHGLGECQAVINFDNCCGQNKNNAVLWYGLWRVLTGLHESLEFAMMVTGHTKFAPDWHFGVWKIRWRASDAESLEEIAASVQMATMYPNLLMTQQDQSPSTTGGNFLVVSLNH